MLCVLFVLILSLLIACSPDRPAPVAPAGKATDDFGSMFDLFQQSQQPTSSEAEQDPPDTTATDTVATLPIEVAEELFNIELAYLDSFTTSEQEWISQVVDQWEPFFNDDTPPPSI